MHCRRDKLLTDNSTLIYFYFKCIQCGKEVFSEEPTENEIDYDEKFEKQTDMI